jgi:type IV secretion system protein VirB5
MKRHRVIVLMLACTFWASGSHAQFAVIDVNAIVQMAQQLRVLQDQLVNARSQLTQAQAQFAALTGSRGMERLLEGATRNYLPPDWAVFERTLRRVETSYAALGAQVEAVIQGNAVLTPEQTAHLVPDQREQLEAARQSAALLQVTSRQALQVSSERFGTLQALIDAIPTATDSKAALDLQARIAAEQAMLQNEHTKLMVFYQTVEAEERAREQRARELAVAHIGSLRRVPAIGLND